MSGKTSLKTFGPIWVLALAVDLVLYWGSPVSATTYYVNPGEYIQDAINLASYGDTVQVAAGMHLTDMTIELKNGVALIGAGQETTTIDGYDVCTVVASTGCDHNTILQGFTITNGFSNYGGGMYNEDSSPTVTNCTFSDNNATEYGGGMYNCDNSSPTVTNCTFSGNSADDHGGGMYNNYSNPTVTNCTFTGNSGGMANGNSSPIVINCVFSGNHAGLGAGMVNENSSPTVTNCTFSSNFASLFGGGMFNLGGSPTVTNCILWGDTPEEISGSVTATYSDIEGGWPGEGNIDADPHFQGASLRLAYNSPCIDAGNNAAVPASITTDLDGFPRFIDDPNTTDTGSGTPPIVDMGAYEYFGNDAPVVDAGGPYTVNQNHNLMLDASASTPGADDASYGDAVVLYEWDLDYDGQFDDHVTTDAITIVPWSTLSTLSRPVGQSLPIALRVTDKIGLTDTAATTLTITYYPTSWGALTIDSTGSVGGYTSLALDSSGNPGISYLDWTNYDLKYAFWNGTDWDIQTVDSNGFVGGYTSLALDSSGNPGISYCDLINYDLKYAFWNGLFWVIQTIDSIGQVGGLTSLALDSSGNPRISYCDLTNADLKYAFWDGSDWVIQTVDSIGNVGRYTSLALDDSSGNPGISYYDASNADLKYASWNGMDWDIQTVDSTGEVGLYTSLAMDSSGNPRISYYDATNGNLKCAFWNGLLWVIQTIDSNWDVGKYTSIALDSYSNPRISYYDRTNSDLKLAVTCVASMQGDWNADCYINFLDVAELASRWLDCSVPFDPACGQ